MRKPKPTSNWGGARKGAGKKPGKCKGTQVVTRSVSMLPKDWAWIDKMRKGVPRGRWIIERLKGK